MEEELTSVQRKNFEQIMRLTSDVPIDLFMKAARLAVSSSSWRRSLIQLKKKGKTPVVVALVRLASLDSEILERVASLLSEYTDMSKFVIAEEYADGERAMITPEEIYDLTIKDPTRLMDLLLSRINTRGCGNGRMVRDAINDRTVLQVNDRGYIIVGERSKLMVRLCVLAMLTVFCKEENNPHIQRLNGVAICQPVDTDLVTLYEDLEDSGVSLTEASSLSDSQLTSLLFQHCRALQMLQNHGLRLGALAFMKTDIGEIEYDGEWMVPTYGTLARVNVGFSIDKLKRYTSPAIVDHKEKDPLMSYPLAEDIRTLINAYRDVVSENHFRVKAALDIMDESMRLFDEEAMNKGDEYRLLRKICEQAFSQLRVK